MAAQIKVKSLFNFCIESVYRGVVSELHKIEQQQMMKEDSKSIGNPPHEKKRKIDLLQNTNVYVRREFVKLIRARLDDYLISWYSHIRNLLVERFIHDYSSHSQAHFYVNMYLAFFDSVLDPSFTSFTLTGTRKKNVFRLPHPTQLLEIITKRSPLLQSLNITFRLPKNVPALNQGFGFLLGTLTRLTNLTLSFGTEENCINLFSSLGQSCPQLTVLQLGQMPFGPVQVLAIVLGSKRALLPPDFLNKMEYLEDLQISLESLNPICSSLKELQYHCSNENSCQNPPVGLILRHFHSLEKLQLLSCCEKFNSSAAIVIQDWYKSQHKRKSPRFQKKQTLTMSSDKLGTLQWTVGYNFIGLLKLVSLRNVVSKSKSMMKAVTSLCPNLKEISFCGYSYSRRVNDFLSVKDLHSLFCTELNGGHSYWVKLKRVNFDSVPFYYRRAVLSILGHQLEALEFSSFSHDIDVVKEIFPYSQLQELRISDNCEVVQPPSSYNLPSATDFLPRLKRLEIDICLGQWSPLFECHRPGLLTFSSACPHFGVPSRGKFRWTDVPELWPGLQKLNLSTRQGLTVDMLREIVFQLEHLEGLTLRGKMFSSITEKPLIKKFQEELKNQNRLTEIEFQPGQSFIHVYH